MKPAQSSLAGIGFVVLATACFASLDTTTKHVTTAGFPVLVALWFRYAIQAVITTVMVWPRQGRAVLRTSQPGYQVLRGALLFSSSLLAFYSLKYLPVGEFTAILLLTPLLITLLAAWMLGERVRLLRWWLVLGGFAGTLVIIRPGADHFGWPMLLPLLMVGISAAFQLLTSRMTRTESLTTMHFYTGWVGTLLASLALPLVWEMPQSAGVWLQLLLMGVLASAGHVLLIKAYLHASAATLMPYMYGQIGFGVLGGWLVFGHMPDGWTFAGMGLVALCGVLGAALSLHEHRQALRQS